jgi:hypothetical protein
MKFIRIVILNWYMFSSCWSFVALIIALLLFFVGAEPVFHGKKILLLEAAPNKFVDKPPEVFLSRTCALSAGSVELLDSKLLI